MEPIKPTAEDDNDPVCEKCGAPITTGLMAAICPRREGCQFWPEDQESQRFLDALDMRAHDDGRESPPAYHPAQ